MDISRLSLATQFHRFSISPFHSSIVLGRCCVGTAAAIAATRTLNTLLFGVKPFDLPTFLATGALLLCVGMLAIDLPAARAAKVDPMVALRDQ